MPLTAAVSIVGEASGQYKTMALFGGDAHFRVHTVMGGARASASIGRLREFAQLAAGLVATSGSAFGATTTARAFGIQPGAGVEWPFNATWSARAQFDVRFVRGAADQTSGAAQLRGAAVLVYHRD